MQVLGTLILMWMDSSIKTVDKHHRDKWLLQAKTRDKCSNNLFIKDWEAKDKLLQSRDWKAPQWTKESKEESLKMLIDITKSRAYDEFETIIK